MPFVPYANYNVSFVLKSDTNHSTFPFLLPCPNCFPLMLNINYGFILVKQTLLSETRFPYLLENKPFVFVSIVFELCVKASIN